jgi:hypothetical protein
MMATKTTVQYFCDKCGTESQEKLISYYLVCDEQTSSGSYESEAATNKADLCNSCALSLFNAVEAWGLKAVVRK